MLDATPGIDCLDVWLPRTPDSVAAARAHTTRACEAWAMPDLDATAALMVSELATNAIVHARTSRIHIVAWHDRPHLIVEVRDNDPRLPIQRAPDLTAEAGRGLLLVDAFSDQWGVIPWGRGKSVWFKLRSNMPRETSA